MKNNKKKTIQILYGLPASGKTTYAENLAKSRSSFAPAECKVLDSDTLFKKAKDDSDKFKELFTKEIAKVCYEIDYTYSINNLIIDGLITTNSEAKEVIEIIKSKMPKSWEVEFEIVCWEKDIEACLWNDRGRRAKSSVNTIKNKVLEVPDIKKIGADKITKKLVVRKPEFLIFFQSLKEALTLEEDKHRDRYRGRYGISKHPQDSIGFVSDAWSLGGESGNCWNDEMYRISPDTNIPTFKEFDNVIESIFPECSFLKYKKIYEKCVSIRDYFESDYYGGGVTHAYYFCDVQALYDTLIEMNMIDSPEIKIIKTEDK
jgi:adenylate kinase family enzyme